MRRLLPLILLSLAACTPAPPPGGDARGPDANGPRPAAADTSADRPDGCERNEAVLAAATEAVHVGPDDVFPWVVPLAEEQVETAVVEDGRVVVPTEGNPWAKCVTRNDVLWKPLSGAVPTFALRVLSVERGPDRVVFRTRNARLPEIFR